VASGSNSNAHKMNLDMNGLVNKSSR